MKNFFKKNKFVILTFTIIMIIMCGFLGTVFGATYEDLDFKYGKVKAKCLNVRCGPGITYSRVGKLQEGEYINVFAKIGNWYIVQTNSNIVGAVSANYVDAVYDENEAVNAQKETSNNSSDVNEQAESSNSNSGNSNNAQTVTSNNEAENSNNTETENSKNENTESLVQTSEFSDSNELTQDEKDFLDLINSNRKNNGLEELQIDYEIQNVARLKAKDLVENNYFSHTSEIYGNIDNMLTTFEISYTSSAENIAGNKTLAGAVEAWMNSENHKVNILNEKYNYTGVAVVDSDTYGKIFVQIFVEK